MNTKKTIATCIREVLKDFPEGLTINEIYEQIIERKLYVFGAKNPKSVVNQEVRRHCVDVTLYITYPIKYFKISGRRDGKLLYVLIDDSTDTPSTISPDVIDEPDEELPIEERIAIHIESYNKTLKEQLLQRILSNDPAFFEHLVIDLLLKMGYGYNESAGIVVGKSHDAGIDGIIEEDKLGLDKIYIQAKRYGATNTVGRKELQAFVGAMSGVQKGVFLTTSSFTKEAKQYIDSVSDKHIKLIDGKLLTDLMLKYGVGIQSIAKYVIHKIDEDYFV